MPRKLRFRRIPDYWVVQDANPFRRRFGGLHFFKRVFDIVHSLPPRRPALCRIRRLRRLIPLGFLAAVRAKQLPVLSGSVVFARYTSLPRPRFGALACP